MKFHQLAVVTLLIFLSLTAVACGADSTGELDKAELIEDLEESGYTKAQAGCVADKVIAADFTKDEVDDASDELSSGTLTSDNKRTQELIETFTSCLASS